MTPRLYLNLCVLNAFAGNYACAGGLANADIVRCAGNDVVNLDDMLSTLIGFSNLIVCPDSAGGTISKSVHQKDLYSWQMSNCN